MSLLRFEIDRGGNFNPDTTQEGIQSDEVEFVLIDGANWPNAYVFSGSPLAPDSDLFGASTVRTDELSTIQSSAVLNKTYTLSVFEDGDVIRQTGIKNGSIKVGS